MSALLTEKNPRQTFGIPDGIESKCTYFKVRTSKWYKPILFIILLFKQTCISLPMNDTALNDNESQGF